MRHPGHQMMLTRKNLVSHPPGHGENHFGSSLDSKNKQKVYLVTTYVQRPKVNKEFFKKTYKKSTVFMGVRALEMS